MSTCGLVSACSPTVEWERLTHARGGSERLSSIHSIALVKTQEWREGLVKRRLEARDVYVLPFLRWSWWKPGSTAFLSVKAFQYDLAKRTKWIASANHGRPTLNRETITTDEMAFADIPVLFLQAGEVRPVPERCVQLADITILDAKLEGILYRFHSRDALTFMVEEFKPDSPYPVIHEIGEYRSVSGLRLPVRYIQTLRGLSPLNCSVQYEINPSYDAETLNRPPSLADGPEAWRSKTRDASVTRTRARKRR